MPDTLSRLRAKLERETERANRAERLAHHHEVRHRDARKLLEAEERKNVQFRRYLRHLGRVHAAAWSVVRSAENYPHPSKEQVGNLRVALEGLAAARRSE